MFCLPQELVKIELSSWLQRMWERWTLKCNLIAASLLRFAHYSMWNCELSHSCQIARPFRSLFCSLRADIYGQICGNLVRSVVLFDGCPENFLRHLCMVVKPAAFMPGDYICLQVSILIVQLFKDQLCRPVLPSWTAFRLKHGYVPVPRPLASPLQT